MKYVQSESLWKSSRCQHCVCTYLPFYSLSQFLHIKIAESKFCRHSNIWTTAQQGLIWASENDITNHVMNVMVDVAQRYNLPVQFISEVEFSSLRPDVYVIMLGTKNVVHYKYVSIYSFVQVEFLLVWLKLNPLRVIQIERLEALLALFIFVSDTHFLKLFKFIYLTIIFILFIILFILIFLCWCEM